MTPLPFVFEESACCSRFRPCGERLFGSRAAQYVPQADDGAPRKGDTGVVQTPDVDGDGAVAA
jgi:hypothetical protein